MGQPFETIKVANQSGGTTMSRAALTVVQRGGVPSLWAVANIHDHGLHGQQQRYEPALPGACGDQRY